VFEHAIDGVADCCHEGLQHGFATCLSIVIESAHVDLDPPNAGHGLKAKAWR